MTKAEKELVGIRRDCLAHALRIEETKDRPNGMMAYSGTSVSADGVIATAEKLVDYVLGKKRRIAK